MRTRQILPDDWARYPGGARGRHPDPVALDIAVEDATTTMLLKEGDEIVQQAAHASA